MTIMELSDRVAALTAERDRLRADLRDAHNDLLDVRGILAPAGYPDVTPLPLVPTVAPAVQWLVDRLAAAEQDRARLQAVNDCYRHALRHILYRVILAPTALDYSLKAIEDRARNALALEILDLSVPPGGYVCAICRIPVESEPCAEHAPKQASTTTPNDSATP